MQGFLGYYFYWTSSSPDFLKHFQWKKTRVQFFLRRSSVNATAKNTVILKLCGNSAFPQNFHTSKLGEISVFYAVWTDVGTCQFG